MSTVLLVEDTPIIREPLARLLADEGYDVSSASDGLQAQMQLATHRPDLIVLDVLMPHMDGLAFLQVLRTDPKTADIPVIALTAVLDSQCLTRLRTLGVKSIVTKGTFTFENLLTEIRQHIIYPPAPKRMAG
jgi:CheY-like chemotaxis protein